MRILVTGGGGFLGHFLLPRLSGEGRRIVALRNRRPLPDGGWIPLDLDLADGAHPGWSVLETASPFDAVVHGAAMASPGDCRRDPERARAVNVTASLRLARLARAWGARFVFVSTDVVFSGDAPPYAEEALPRPGTVYGRTKAEAEEALLRLGGEFVVLRSSLLYRRRGTGPAEERDWILRALGRGEEVRLYRNQLRQPLLAEDLATVIDRVLRAHGPPPCLHVGGREVLDRHVFGRAMAAHFGLDGRGIRGVDYDPASDVEAAPLDLTLDLGRLRDFLGHELVGATEALGYNGEDRCNEEEP